MKHLGDYDASTVIYGKFSTYRPSTGAAYTLGGTPALSVYKDNSTTQSTTGVTLTVDFDSVTGLHHFAIDTSADGAFYAAGSFFDIVITTGTVDGVSVVGTVVASFTLRKNSALKPTTAGRTLDVSAGGEAGVDWANVGTPSSTVNLSGTTVKTATDVETDTQDIQNRLPAALVGGRMDANMGAISADSVAADNAEAFFDGTGYAGTNNVIPTVTTVNGLGAGVITAASIAASALDGKGNWNVGKTGYTLTPTTGLGNQTANITGNLSGSVGSVTGNVGGNVTGSVGSVAAGGITTASFASGAIDAVALATDAANEIRDAVWAKTLTELTGDPGATPSAAAAVMLPFMGIRNLRLTDSALGTDKIHNDAGVVILTASISDAASIFTKAKYA